MRRWSGLFALLLLAACGKSSSGPPTGRQIFTSNCARCHGMGGVPDPGTQARTGVKDLTQPKLQDRLTDAQIRDQIVNGSDNRLMPAFGQVFNPAQIDALVAHVRSLRDDPTKLP